jgi:hypothetical protein
VRSRRTSRRCHVHGRFGRAHCVARRPPRDACASRPRTESSMNDFEQLLNSEGVSRSVWPTPRVSGPTSDQRSVRQAHLRTPYTGTARAERWRCRIRRATPLCRHHGVSAARRGSSRVRARRVPRLVLQSHRSRLSKRGMRRQHASDGAAPLPVSAAPIWRV